MGAEVHDLMLESPAGPLRLRPEGPEDQAFRFRLFCASRPPEWDWVQLEPALREQLMRHQFAAQTMSYAAQFPAARFDIVELGGEPVGRIVVNRAAGHIHIVDQAIVPEHRNKGIGTAIMRRLMEEAAERRVPVRLKVSSSNDPSLRLYQRLGFIEIDATPGYLEMEWREPSRSA